MSSTFTISLLAASAALFNQAAALNNGLGLVPQMGWNTWNKFACDIDEQLIYSTVDQIKALGLADLGYNYVNLDDCWQEELRTATGHVIPDRVRFPNGMKVVGDYIHAQDLKYGIYSCAGTMTCQGKAGSLGFEQIDAQDYADWGVDYLKYDNCYNNSVSALQRYPAMRDALLSTGRDIFYSICNWGEENTWQWAPHTGNSWRTTQDIWDGWASIEFNFKESQKHANVSGPGGWNDPDMLEVGNGGLTLEEEKTHFALWALAKAPLIIGCDLTTVRPESLAILKNKWLIDVNQDPESRQATCRIGCDTISEWMRWPQTYATTVSGGDVVAILVNWREVPTDEYLFNFEELGVVPSPSQSVEVTDLWTGQVVGRFAPRQKVGVKSIAGHGNYVFRFSIVDNVVSQ